MKLRKIKLIVLFAAMLFSSSAFSVNESSTPICLYYSNTPRIDGIRQPHRVPSVRRLSIEVAYDEITTQLVFTDNQAHKYYYIVSDDNTVSEGYLDFENQECISISLDTMISGTYTLTVIYEGSEFSGSFDI